MSEVSDRVARLLREYDPKYSTVILYRSFFNPVEYDFAGPGTPRFVGTVSNIVITDPDEDDGGSGGSVRLTCKNFISDLDRSSPATRSDAWQRKRNSDDTFRKYAATIGTREFFWGRR